MSTTALIFIRIPNLPEDYDHRISAVNIKLTTLNVCGVRVSKPTLWQSMSMLVNSLHSAQPAVVVMWCELPKAFISKINRSLHFIGGKECCYMDGRRGRHQTTIAAITIILICAITNSPVSRRWWDDGYGHLEITEFIRRSSSTWNLAWLNALNR